MRIYTSTAALCLVFDDWAARGGAEADNQAFVFPLTMATAAPEVEGQMSPQAVEGIAGQHNSALMTLDEPVSATIVRHAFREVSGRCL